MSIYEEYQIEKVKLRNWMIGNDFIHRSFYYLSDVTRIDIWVNPKQGKMILIRDHLYAYNLILEDFNIKLQWTDIPRTNQGPGDQNEDSG